MISNRWTTAERESSTPLSRRELLIQGGAAAFLLAGGAGVRTASAERLDPRVPALLAATISVDIHTHAGGAHFAKVPKYDVAAHMKAGGMSALCLCHTGDGPVIRHDDASRSVRAFREAQPGELYRHTLRRLDYMDDVIANHGMARILTPQDLDAAKAAGKPALIGSIEGCQFMDGKLERIQEVYSRGTRQLQLVHFLLSELGDQQTEKPVHGGLSPLGMDAVRECNRLGIVVDVAHGTFEMARKAAEVTSAPLILSHTSLAQKTAIEFSRRVFAPHAKCVADTGGVIGVWPNQGSFPNAERWATGVAQMVDAVGIDHVGIGTDVGGSVHSLWDDYADLPTIADLFLRHGFSPTDTGKLLGENYVRVFRKVYAARKV